MLRMPHKHFTCVNFNCIVYQDGQGVLLALRKFYFFSKILNEDAMLHRNSISALYKLYKRPFADV